MKFRLYIKHMVTVRIFKVRSIIYLFICRLPNEVISSEDEGRKWA